MQMVTNTDGEVVAVPDAEDVRKAERSVLTGALAALVFAIAIGAWTARMEVGLNAQTRETARVELSLVNHLESENKREEGITLLLRLTDSMRIEMRYLADAIKGQR